MQSIEYPRNSGLKISERKNSSSSKDSISFRIFIPAKYGLQKRYKQFTKLKDAKDYCTNLYDNLKRSGRGLRGLSESEMSEVQLAYKKLKDAGISLTEAVDYAIPKLRARANKMMLSDLIKEYINWKENDLEKGLIREVYFKSIQKKSGYILKHLGDFNIADIDREAIKALFSKFKFKVRTKENYFNQLGSLLKYATNEGYIESNPIEAITDTDKRIVIGRRVNATEDINILSLKDTRTLLETALANPYMGLLPGLIVQLFCGVRATESAMLSWEDIKYDADSPYINISAQIAKGRNIRHTEEIPKNALLWLSLCDKSKSFGFSNLKRRDNQMDRLKQKCGFGKWVKEKGNNDRWVVRKGMKNVLRHSFGSYHFELHKDAIRTSRAMGHKYGNDDLLFTHYREAIPRGEGDKYFNIVPKPSGEKVIPISSLG